MRVTLIHNPGAGAQGAGDAERLQRVLREAGHRVRYQSSQDDAWKKALKKPGEAEQARLLRYLDSWRENRERIAVLPSHRTYANSYERSKAWLPWRHRYNWHRPHASLNYQPPIRRLGCL